MWHERPNKSRHSGNGIACLQATPRAALGFCSANRAENLCYQFVHGQKTPAAISQDCLLGAFNWVGHPHPKRKPICSELINGMCNLQDVTKPPTASLWSGLLTFTHSRDTYTRTLFIQSVLINGMCLFGVGVRKANAEISAEQDGCTSEQVRVVLCTCERVA